MPAFPRIAQRNSSFARALAQRLLLPSDAPRSPDIQEEGVALANVVPDTHLANRTDPGPLLSPYTKALPLSGLRGASPQPTALTCSTLG